MTLCEVPQPFGATWSDDDTIFFGQGPRGIWRVSGAGGTPEVVIPVEEGEQAHEPQQLPDGDWVLFTLRPANSASWDTARIVAQSLTTAERKILIEGGTDARYLPTGHLVYALRGTMLAVPFDPKRRQVTGGPVPLLDGVLQVAGGQTGAAQFSVSSTGTLMYLSDAGAAVGQRSLVWVDRRGREERTGAPVRDYVGLALSPDGTRVALNALDEERDIWIWSFARRTFTRFTFDPAADAVPRWTRDGRRIVFQSGRGGGVLNLFWQAADGTGAPERLTESPNPQVANSFSRDATRLVFHETDPKTGVDLRMLSLGGDRRAETLLQTTFAERNGEISPDGRWIAYDSNESGRAEVYVRPFPTINDGRWQISTDGGVRPIWAPNGRELFYLAPGESTTGVMAVAVEAASSFSTGNPEVLFEGAYLLTGTNRAYEVAPDGQRFLMIKDEDPSADSAAHIIVVENWLEELKRLVPGN